MTFSITCTSNEIHRRENYLHKFPPLNFVSLSLRNELLYTVIMHCWYAYRDSCGRPWNKSRSCIQASVSCDSIYITTLVIEPRSVINVVVYIWNGFACSSHCLLLYICLYAGKFERKFEMMRGSSHLAWLFFRLIVRVLIENYTSLVVLMSVYGGYIIAKFNLNLYRNRIYYMR